MPPSAWRTIGILLVLLTGPILTGCVAPDEPSAGPYRLSGTFTQDASQDEMQELGDAVRARGGTMALLESHPVQFRATGLDASGCGEVRTLAQGQDYVAHVGPCHIPGSTDGSQNQTST